MHTLRQGLCLSSDEEHPRAGTVTTITQGHLRVRGSLCHLLGPFPNMVIILLASFKALLPAQRLQCHRPVCLWVGGTKASRLLVCDSWWPGWPISLDVASRSLLSDSFWKPSLPVPSLVTEDLGQPPTGAEQLYHLPTQLASGRGSSPWSSQVRPGPQPGREKPGLGPAHQSWAMGSA